jgi:hypothetical protein
VGQKLRAACKVCLILEAEQLKGLGRNLKDPEEEFDAVAIEILLNQGPTFLNEPGALFV